VATSNTLPTPAVRRYVLVVLTTAYMFNFIDRTILSILLPAIRDEFRVGDAVLGFLAGPAFALFYVTLGVPIARLADRVNRRNLIAAAVAVWSVMTALSGLAGSVWQLALARIGVGIGEAGGNPPAHSMIADLYPPERRAAAMGFYTLGVSAGIMLAYLGGGWIVANVGWRDAFYGVGLPGLAVALVVRFTIREPARGESEARSDSGDRPAMPVVLRFLARRRSFLHMALAAGLSSFVGYSVLSFLPSFIHRSFEVDIATLGVWLGLIYGLASGFGFYTGGYLSDRLGRRGHRRSLAFIALATLASTVFYAAMFLASSARACLILSAVPIATSGFYLAPVFAQTQGLVSLRMRAVASSILILVINSVGLALGPWLTGIASDALAPVAGPDSMRYSLLAVSTLLLPWSAWHFHRAAGTIETDLARAEEHD
jgi:predicted MFS family arabinose efflux permease